jgi:predicted Zn-dependent protease
MNETSRSVRRAKFGIRLVVLVVGVGVLAVTARQGASAYRSWKAGRLIKSARAYIEKSDLRNATLCLRKAILSNPSNIDAARMMAELAEASGSGNAIGWRSRVVELAPTIAQYRLDWANTALRLGNYGAANQALLSFGEADQKTAGYLKTVAILALALNQPWVAESNFVEAARLEPTNPIVQLNIASLRLQSTNQTVSDEARRQTQQLAANPVVRCDALRHLATDALVHRAFDRALGFCDDLLKESGSAFSDRVLQLEVMHRAKHPQFNGRLSQAQHDALENAQNVFALGQWMLSTGQGVGAAAWLKTFTPTQLAKQPIPMIAVECLAALREWNSLETMLDGQNWGEIEYYRLALRARVYREQKEDTPARSAWLRTLKATDNRLERLSHLARVTGNWGWNDEMDELLDTIVKRYPTEKWAVQKLSASFHARGKTAALKNLLARVAEAEPANLAVKNNLALTSLLLDPRDAKSFSLARQVYEQQPANPFFVSTYAYSLHLQEKNREALQLFQTLKPEQLDDPSVAAYYGIVLADVGEQASAKKHLAMGERAKLLPEERTLIKSAQRGE